MQTGSKAGPAAVARSVMCANDATRDRLFSSDEFLTATQIAGFFPRLASKKTLENDGQEGVEVAAHEACLERIVNEAASEIAAKHSIVYNAYNLCEMVSQKKLNEFSITILKDICASFGIDTAGITVRRKKPYICQECACQQ